MHQRLADKVHMKQKPHQMTNSDQRLEILTSPNYAEKGKFQDELVYKSKIYPMNTLN